MTAFFRLISLKINYDKIAIYFFTVPYSINPAKAEQMYFPVFYGRNQMKQVAIQQE